MLILALDGKAALALNPMPAFGFTSAANPVPLPKTKPRAVRKHFVVLSIGSREVARAQRSSVRHCEDALKTFDFGNCLLRVHSISISNIVVAIVKRSGICAFPQWPVGAIPNASIKAYGDCEQLSREG